MVTKKIFNGFLALLLISGILDSSMAIYCSQGQQASTKEDTRWECNTCEASYAYRSGLSRHKSLQRNKATGKRFICKECSASFVLLDYLQNHMKSHNETGTYACRIGGCTKVYRQITSLCRHRKQAHSREDIARHKKRVRGSSTKKERAVTKKQKKDKGSGFSTAVLNELFDRSRTLSKQEVDDLDAAVFESLIEASRANAAPSVKVDKRDLLQVI